MNQNNLSATGSADFDGKSLQFPGISVKRDQLDELLANVLVEGDYNAFKKMFLLMYPVLCTFCLRFVSEREVAEELVSDVFYSIWKNRDRLNVTCAKAYLYASVRNRGIDYIRKNRKTAWCTLEEAGGLEADYPSGQDVLIGNELTTRYEQSVALLPRQCRLIFELSREQGMKYKEIATTLNISVKTVETQMGRALKYIRKSLPSV